jgi:hypothetical protein
MVLAGVAIVGTLALMLWLGWVSQPSAAAAVEEGPPAGAETSLAEPVAAATFETSMANYVGREISLNGVTVEQQLSPQLAWLALPSGTLFLVKLAPGAAALTAGQTVNVVGSVMEKTDATLDSWQQSGALQDAGQRQQAEFGTHFIEARSVSRAQAG